MSTQRSFAEDRIPKNYRLGSCLWSSQLPRSWELGVLGTVQGTEGVQSPRVDPLVSPVPKLQRTLPATRVTVALP